MNLLPRLALLDWLARIRDGGPAQLIVFSVYVAKKELVDPPPGLATSWKPDAYKKWATAARLARDEFRPWSEALALSTKEQAKQQLKIVGQEKDRVFARNRYVKHTREKTAEVAKVAQGQIPSDVTSEDLLKYVAQFLTPDVDQMLSDEWESKERQEQLLNKLAD